MVALVSRMGMSHHYFLSNGARHRRGLGCTIRGDRGRQRALVAPVSEPPLAPGAASQAEVRNRPGGGVMTTTVGASRRTRVAASLHGRLARPSPTVWLSGQEAAEYVGVSWPTLRQASIEHVIPHVRLGTLWRIEVAMLDEHLRRLADIGPDGC